MPLRTPPLIQSQNGTLDARLTMVNALYDSNPIIYGGDAVYSTPPNPNPRLGRVRGADGLKTGHPVEAV